MLGSALQPALSSYSDRSLTVSAPEAPINLDLGAGSYRLMPPYRGGYLIVVGSDYNVSAVGRLLDAAGQPVALLSGTAIELAHPEREPIPFFTNRDGRFGIVGLAPGEWRLQTAGTPGETYRLQVPETQDTVAAGETQTGPRRFVDRHDPLRHLPVSNCPGSSRDFPPMAGVGVSCPMPA